jgi:hypothetical protein
MLARVLTCPDDAAEMFDMLDKAQQDIQESEALKNKLANDLAVEKQSAFIAQRRAFQLQQELKTLKSQLAPP